MQNELLFSNSGDIARLHPKITCNYQSLPRNAWLVGSFVTSQNIGGQIKNLKKKETQLKAKIVSFGSIKF